MTTTTRGRYTTRTRPTYGSYSSYSFGSGNPWGNTTNNRRRNNNNSRRTNNNRRTGTNTTAYKTCCNNFERKIDSYRTLCQQAQGSGTWDRPTPTTLNNFANWVNKGAVIQCVSATQVARWARNTNKNFNPRNPSPTACKNVLTAKFGRSVIKAVARTKNGTFMVATTPTINGRTFSFPR